MSKREMIACRLHALTFNYLDLLFCQPVKLVDQVVCLALEERSAFIPPRSFGLGDA
jgi:hypothetical protein